MRPGSLRHAPRSRPQHTCTRTRTTPVSNPLSAACRHLYSHHDIGHSEQPQGFLLPSRTRRCQALCAHCGPHRPRGPPQPPSASAQRPTAAPRLHTRPAPLPCRHQDVARSMRKRKSVHGAVACMIALPQFAAHAQSVLRITGCRCHVTRKSEDHIPLCLHALRVNGPVAVWVQPDGLYGHVWERQVRLHAEFMCIKLLKQTRVSTNTFSA